MLSRALRRTACLAGILVACACGDGGDERARDRAAARPHVLLVSVDTLRADRLGATGYERPTTPHLSALADEGILFTNALAQATFTLTSHKSLFASRYPQRLLREQTQAGLATLSGVPATEHEPLIVSAFAQVRDALLVDGLRRHGYATAAFTDGAWMSRDLGFAEGFEVFDDRAGRLARILPRVEAWLEARDERPFFLFVHTYDVHAPYHGPEPFNSAYCDDHTRHIPLDKRCNQVDCGRPPLMRIELSEDDLRGVGDHYDGGIARADDGLGRLFGALREAGVYDETLIVVTSDHGESLGEHDQIGHGGLTLEQLRVPLFVKPPRSWGVAPGVIEAPVELVDVMPTVYEACGLALPGPRDGVPLQRLLADGGAWPRRYALAQTAHDEGRDKRSSLVKRALWEPGRWLLVHDALGERSELYDLAADPRGTVDVAAERPDALAALLERLRSVDRDLDTGSFARPAAPALSDELQRDLRALGY